MGTNRIQRLGLTLALAAALLALCGASNAADGDKTVSRERELLRRAQAALRAEQEQHSSSEREKAALAADKAKLEGDAKRAASQLSALQGQSRSAHEKAERAQAEAERLQRELAAALDAQRSQQQTIETLTGQLAETRRQLAERSNANVALLGVLERSTQALTNAETKNRDLHAAALKAVDAYRKKGLADVIGQREPLFGLREVELENIAEELRTQIDAQRLPSAFKPDAGEALK